MNMLYEPREDSYLLEKNVRKYVNGNVLDMGTGTGIQAKAAHESGAVVTAVDINPEAVKYFKKKFRNKDILVIKSDLFESVTGKFDWIIFNPPYLPDDKRVKDIALDGGRHGYELIGRFLDSVVPYLNNQGKILLLFSSLSKKDKIEEFIQKNCLKFSIVDKQKLDFEELYVYLIEKSNLLLKLEKKAMSGIYYLTKGHRGIIYTGKLGGKKMTIKAELKTSFAINRLENEVNMLKRLNKKNIGPKLVFNGQGYFVYEFVDGMIIDKYIEKYSKENIKKTFLEIIKQLFVMDNMGISKEEMHHPYKHILVLDKPVLIDFERAHFTENPQNITQFLSYLNSLTKRLSKKNIFVTKNRLIALSKKYHENRNIEPIQRYINEL